MSPFWQTRIDRHLGQLPGIHGQHSRSEGSTCLPVQGFLIWGIWSFLATGGCRLKDGVMHLRAAIEHHAMVTIPMWSRHVGGNRGDRTNGVFARKSPKEVPSSSGVKSPKQYSLEERAAIVQGCGDVAGSFCSHGEEEEKKWRRAGRGPCHWHSRRAFCGWLRRGCRSRAGSENNAIPCTNAVRWHLVKPDLHWFCGTLVATAQA